MNRYEIRLCGSGGQGIILAGLILAEVSAKKIRYVAQSQSYGPAARGGNCMSEVILSDHEIDYPKAMFLDALVALSQEACDLNWQDVKSSGILLVDSGQVKHLPPRDVVILPFTELALRATNNTVSANMAALGALVQTTSLLSLKAVEEGITRRSPGRFAEANIKIFRAGARVAKKTFSLQGLPMESFSLKK